MKAKITLAILIALTLGAQSAYGYEVSTHAALSREAFNRSALQTTDLLTRLGVSQYSEGLGDIYFDMNPTIGDVRVRKNNPAGNEACSLPDRKCGDKDYTKEKFDGANKLVLTDDIPDIKSPAGWLMVGAIREDDVAYDGGAGENPPQDDPQGSFARVLNHFYDPSIGLPLAYIRTSLPQVLVPLGSRAPDWSIEGKDIFDSHTNHFSIKDAKEALFRASTLRKLEEGQLRPLALPINGASLSKEAQRKAYWATVFRALGDVVHTLQDMGQPQHTRNDAHAGLGCVPYTGLCAMGHASFYEKYLEARVTGNNTFTLPRRIWSEEDNNPEVSPPIKMSALVYNGYTVPRFNSYRGYYSAGTGDASYSGKGLANYSNKGFYSAGTNVGIDPLNHARPPKDGAGLVPDVKLPEQVLGLNGRPIQDNDAILMLLRYPVEDSFTGQTAPNVPISSVSVFDKFLRDKTGKPAYSLNHYNYNAMADLLIPRAVSYSAGLIDYFFRGQMEISPPKEGVYGVVDHARFVPAGLDESRIDTTRGFNKIKLKLKNTTPNVVTWEGSYPQKMSDGILVAVVKFRRNTQYKVNLDAELLEDDPMSKFYAQRSKEEEIVVSAPVPLSSLNPGQSTDLTFDFSAQEIPINIWFPVKLSIVFRGKLGDEEDAVVVTEKYITSPIYVSYRNTRDYLMLNNGGCYTPAQIEADEQLQNLMDPQCNGGGTPFRVADSCRDQPMEAKISIINGSSKITFAWTGEGGALPAPKFGRIAYLADENTVGVSLVDHPNATSYWTTPPQYIIPMDNWSKNRDFIYPSKRGINYHIDGGLVFNATTNGLGNNGGCHFYLSTDHPTALKDEDRYPMPATSVTGW